MSPDPKVIDYIEPTPEQIAARKRRSNAIGAALLAFCVLVFVLMIVKIKSLGAG